MVKNKIKKQCACRTKGGSGRGPKRKTLAAMKFAELKREVSMQEFGIEGKKSTSEYFLGLDRVSSSQRDSAPKKIL